MHGSYLLAALDTRHIVHVAFTGDPSNLLTVWRSRHGAILPLVIERASLEQPAVVEVLKIVAPYAPIALAADKLSDFGIASEAYRIVSNSIRQLRELSVPLLNEWRNAVAGSRGVLAT